MEVLAFGSKEMLTRPCVDCGVVTGRFCDWCFAEDRCPTEQWAAGQMTPLCSYCDNTHNACHFCRRQSWCVPPPSTQRPSTRTTSTNAASAGATSARGSGHGAGESSKGEPQKESQAQANDIEQAQAPAPAKEGEGGEGNDTRGRRGGRRGR